MNQLPTFTTASLLYPCEHHEPGRSVCGRVNSPMVVAWVPYADPPLDQHPRRSGFHLCPLHRAQWEREGIPTWVLAWVKDWRRDLTEAFGDIPAETTTALSGGLFP